MGRSIDWGFFSFSSTRPTANLTAVADTAWDVPRKEMLDSPWSFKLSFLIVFHLPSWFTFTFQGTWSVQEVERRPFTS